jgi:hypothetical protein
MLKIIVSLVTAISAFALIILLNLTTPSSAGPLGILAVFLFSYLLLVGFFTYVLRWGSQIATYLSVVFRARRPLPTLSFKRSYYYSTIFAAAPIMLVGLQSVGRIGIYEYFLVLIFITVGVLYISKRIS